ncbi:MAG: hypothetical protein AMXMBFR84_39910 [Candidatus Hydrogenedentota bacterium]
MVSAKCATSLAYVSVGSNIRPEDHIVAALERLHRETAITSISTFYRTAPLGRPEQPEFLNGLVAVRTDLPPRQLKYDVLRNIEDRLGRLRSDDKDAARTIDLDIVLYDNWIVEEPDLRIPDPDLWIRPFLAVPLLEVAPDTVLPTTGEPLRALVSAMDVGGLREEKEFTACLRASLAP